MVAISAALLSEELSGLAQQAPGVLLAAAATRRRPPGGGRLPASTASSSSGSSATASAASRVIRPACTRSPSDSSRRRMPKPLPRCCRLGIWNVLLSRMRLQSAMRPGQQLDRGDHPAPVGGRQQALADDEVQPARERHAHLLLVGRREEVDEAVDRLGRARRVHRAEHEVARLARGERHAHRLGVAQLADDDDVRVLAQRRLERARRTTSCACPPRAGSSSPSCAGARTRPGPRP